MISLRGGFSRNASIRNKSAHKKEQPPRKFVLKENFYSKKRYNLMEKLADSMITDNEKIFNIK